MWVFALAAYVFGVIKLNHFTGASIAVIYLNLINPPTLFFLKRTRKTFIFRYVSILINFLEIIGYTAIIYAMGGLECSYLTLVYAAVIIYVGMVSPKSMPYLLAIFCAVGFTSMILLENLGALPHQFISPSFDHPFKTQLFTTSAIVALLFVIAYISSFTSGLLKKNRNTLRRQNLELEEKAAEIERTEKELRLAHQELERRVAERTEELENMNSKLIIEIEERKRVEDALRLSEEKVREIFDNVSDYLYFHDLDGFFMEINNSLRKEFGLKEGDIEQFHIKNMMSQESDDFFDEYMKRIMENGKDEGLFRFKSQSHKNVIVEYKNSLVRDMNGNPMGVLGSGRDITQPMKAEKEKQKLRDQLLRAQKMEAIGTLAGGVAHDLNNILSGLVSYPQLLLLDLPTNSPLAGPISTIQKSGEKAAAIVQDLLTLARRGVSVTEILNLNHIITDYIKSPEFEKLNSFHNKIEVKLDIETDVLAMIGSPVHLFKMLMNLVSNAAEAMPEGGQIRISTQNFYIDRKMTAYDHIEEADYILLEVTDTGVGISEEDKEKIFEPFYTKKVMGRSGTGLGMAVVWGTVKDHNGFIDIQSREGIGTSFKLFFPATSKQIPDRLENQSYKDYMGNGESILVIDDVKEQRNITTKMLSKMGYLVDTVSSGEEAIEYLKTRKMDLVILDMIMDPGLDGLETYKKIIEYCPNQKAIIASGYSETERVREAQKLGAGSFVKKPFLMENIGLAVRKELDRH